MLTDNERAALVQILMQFGNEVQIKETIGHRIQCLEAAMDDIDRLLADRTAPAPDVQADDDTRAAKIEAVAQAMWKAAYYLEYGEGEPLMSPWVVITHTRQPCMATVGLSRQPYAMLSQRRRGRRMRPGSANRLTI